MADPHRGAQIRGALLLGLLIPATPWTGLVGTAQAQEAEAPTGIVRITSPQPGATVHIDNELAGTAPVTKYLPAGKHFIRVSVDGFDPFVRRVQIDAGTTTDVAAQLFPGEGTVEFIVEPPGARLLINGKDEWPTPVRLSDIRPGRYTYQLDAPGHESTQGEFEFQRGRNLLQFHRLKNTAGLFEITTKPEGARVWLDGETVGGSPAMVEDVPSGVHVVQVELDGYGTAFRKLDNSDGSKGEVHVRLKEGGAALSIATGDPNAQVAVYGTTIGTGNTVKLKAVERGRYDVSVSAPGMGTAQGRLDVPANGRVAYRAKLPGPDARGPGRIVRVRPIYERWTFWTGIGLVGAGAGAGGYLAWKAAQPEPIPEGDVIITLP